MCFICKLSISDTCMSMFDTCPNILNMYVSYLS
jgi:hypothetical protein